VAVGVRLHDGNDLRRARGGAGLRATRPPLRHELTDRVKVGLQRVGSYWGHPLARLRRFAAEQQEVTWCCVQFGVEEAGRSGSRRPSRHWCFVPVH